MVNSCNKDEFDRRRLMRLQQVRQQSKVFAEKVRKKVQQNKPIKPSTTPTTTTYKQSDFEQKSEEQLQNWQAKKLLELQNQYQDAINEIGLGQRQVESVVNEEDAFNQRQVINEKTAGERGRNALDKLQVEKNEQNIKQAIPIQRKKVVRDVENDRAANLQKVQQNKSFKTKTKKTNPSGVVEQDNQHVDDLNSRITLDSTTKCKDFVTKEQQTTPSLFEEMRIKDKFVQTTEPDLQPQQFPKDTRISERIKCRHLFDPLKDLSVTASDGKTDDDVAIETEKPDIVCCPHCQCGGKEQQEIVAETRKTDAIPIKSRVKLKQTIDSVPTRTTTTTTTNLPSSVRVDRIGNDDFTTSPILSDRELEERIEQREKEAKSRGRKALERERVNRDYRELLHNLPVLQRQELLLELGKKQDDQKFHMTDERLKERERKKQNQMDNVYEKLFAKDTKLTTVTLPRKQDIPNSDTDKDFGKFDENLHNELKQLLENLQKQKDELLCENRSDDKKRKRNVISPISSDNDVCHCVESKTTQTQLGRKKQKVRPKRDVLILQNISTQTSPRRQTDDVATSPIISNRIDGKPEIPKPCTCDIDPNKHDPYEIIIKIQQDNQPEVVVINPPVASKTKIQSPPPPPQPRLLWRHILKENCSPCTTSTSYLSPPEFSKSSSSKHSNNDGKKPAQRKRSTKCPKDLNGNIDPRLLKYIQKLLESSRQFVDELSASSPSNVSTPSQTIIDLQSNHPVKKLRNVMKYFNLTSEDVKNALKSNENSLSSVEKTPIDRDKPKRTLAQYWDIVEGCSEKISNLNEMIDKVRAEKEKILSGTTATTTTTEDFSNESSSAAIHKLFDVDLGYASKLKTLTPQELKQQSTNDGGEQQTTAEMLSDVELLERYRRLMEVPSRQDENTPPMTLNIPKLPKYYMSTPLTTTTTTPPTTTASTMANKAKPPPSKGLTTPQHNLGIPHELSTIPEIELGFIKTIVESNDDSEKSLGDGKMEQMLNSIGMSWAIPTLRKTRQALEMASSSTVSMSSSNDDIKNIKQPPPPPPDSGGRSPNKNQEILKSILSRHFRTDDGDDRITSTPMFGVDRIGGDLFETELSSVQEQDENGVHRFYDYSTRSNNNNRDG